MIIQLISGAVLVFYFILIIYYYIGWRRIKPVHKKNKKLKVSIVIAVRNEEKEIKRLLNNLSSQIYPKQNLQFIVVNDHSSDNTLKLLREFSLESLTVLDLKEGSSGKKDAIQKAIQKAEGEIIIITDADCSLPINWVQTMINYFTSDDIKLVSGPVAYHHKSGFFQSFQALDFLSLIGSGAGAIGSGNAIFCNGANMAYRKDVFLELNAYKDDNTVSGDDVFLLHSIKKTYSKAIAFAKDKDAIVHTKSTDTVSHFINQRKRWTAKTINYTDLITIFTSLLVFFINFNIVIACILFCLDIIMFKYLAYLYLSKYLIDFIFLVPILYFFQRKDLIKWIFPFGLFYPFYIVLTVVISFTSSFEWKGRIHNK